MKKFSLTFLLLFLILVIPLTVRLLEQRRETRKQATESNQVLLYWQPNRQPPYYSDEPLEVDLMLNTQNNPIDTVQVLLQRAALRYPFTVRKNEISGFTWEIFDYTHETMKFLLHSNMGTTFSNSQPVSLLTFTLFPDQPGTSNFVFDRAFTKALLAGVNLLAEITDTGYDISLRPNPTPTSTSRPTPAATPNGSLGEFILADQATSSLFLRLDPQRSKMVRRGENFSVEFLGVKND